MEWQRDKGWSHFNSTFFAVVRTIARKCVCCWWLYKTPKSIHSKGLQWWIQLFWDVFLTRTLHYHPNFFIGEYRVYIALYFVLCVCVLKELSHASYTRMPISIHASHHLGVFFSIPSFIHTHTQSIWTHSGQNHSIQCDREELDINSESNCTMFYSTPKKMWYILKIHFFSLSLFISLFYCSCYCLFWANFQFQLSSVQKENW